MATTNDAWLELIQRVYHYGAQSSPRGLRVRELLCHTTVVNMRWPIVTVPRRKIGYRFMFAEAWWVLSGRNDVDGISPYSPHISSFSDDEVSARFL